MAGEEVINTSADVATDIIIKLGSIGIWLQAIGFVIILWLIFQIISWILDRKNIKKLEAIRSDLERIEKKVDKILKRH